jgi:hypothetical protein
MNRLASIPATERRVAFAEAAERLQIQTVIGEKDIWVCWMLGRLLGRTEWREALVFKGGTALSRVFGIIRRFSKDIDLSVSPATLAISPAAVWNSIFNFPIKCGSACTVHPPLRVFSMKGMVGMITKSNIHRHWVLAR